MCEATNDRCATTWWKGVRSDKKKRINGKKEQMIYNMGKGMRGDADKKDMNEVVERRSIR